MKNTSYSDYRNRKSMLKQPNMLNLMGYVIIVVLLVLILFVNWNNTMNNSNNINLEFNKKRRLAGESCDSNEMDLNLSFNGNVLNNRELTSRILPGVQFFTYSYNLLQGKSPFDLLLSGKYHQIFKLSFDDNKITAGSKAYRVPNELDIPAITGVCYAQSTSSSFSSSTSTASLYQANQESTQTNSGDASVKASGWGFSAHASFSMSLTHSKSSGVSTSLSHAREGKTEARYTYSMALLYATAIRWKYIISNCDEIFVPEFLQDIRDLETEIQENGVESSHECIVQFLGTWGTHVLKLGKLGAHCKESAYFSSGFSQESYEKSSEHASSNNNQYSGKVDAHGGGFGFHGSVSAAYEHCSGDSYNSKASTNSEISQSAEYSQETTYCSGEVGITSICGGMLGTEDEPALVGYELLPIWDLNLCSDSVSNAIKTTINAIINGGVTLCGGIAIPAANYEFWLSEDYLEWSSSDGYSQFWDETVCFDQYSIGLVLLTTGDDHEITNPLSVETNYVRREYKKIKYGEFCQESDKIIIILALQSFPGQEYFGVELANKQKNAFTVDFFVGKNEVTDIGSSLYLLLCDDIKTNIYGGSFSVEYTEASDTWSTYTYETDIPDALTCTSDEYNVFIAMKSVPQVIDAEVDVVILSSKIDTLNDKIKFTAYSCGALNPFDVSYIIHCNSERILATDTYIY